MLNVTFVKRIPVKETQEIKIELEKREYMIGDEFNKDDVELLKNPIILEATDAELERIRDEFIGIPMNTKKDSVRWSGDIAMFIFDNWFSELKDTKK